MGWDDFSGAKCISICCATRSSTAEPCDRSLINYIGPGFGAVLRASVRHTDARLGIRGERSTTVLVLSPRCLSPAPARAGSPPCQPRSPDRRPRLRPTSRSLRSRGTGKIPTSTCSPSGRSGATSNSMLLPRMIAGWNSSVSGTTARPIPSRWDRRLSWRSPHRERCRMRWSATVSSIPPGSRCPALPLSGCAGKKALEDRRGLVGSHLPKGGPPKACDDHPGRSPGPPERIAWQPGPRRRHRGSGIGRGS